MQNYIVYQAYGQECIRQECMFSILSLCSLKVADKYQIVVYTDKPEDFALLKPINGLHLSFEILKPEQIQEWRGEIDFVHRVKICLLLDVCDKYKGNILYLDTDTYFTEDPQPLFEHIASGTYVMHLPEGRIDSGQNLVFKKLYRFLRKNNFTIQTPQKNILVEGKTLMWNAGVVGLSSNDRSLLDEVLLFNDSLHKKYPKHITEQLGFSYFMQQHKLVPADHFIYHYWNFKEFRMILKELFKFLNSRNDVNLFFKVFPKILPQDLVQSKLAYQQLPFIQKNFRKLIGRKYVIPRIDFDELIWNK